MITYVSVKIAYVYCFFLKFDLDYLITPRTPPYHSWRNSAKRVMSTLNLGLQCIGIMRKAGRESFEKEMTQCGNMKALRRIAGKRKEFKEDLLDSVECVKVLPTQNLML